MSPAQSSDQRSDQTSRPVIHEGLPTQLPDIDPEETMTAAFHRMRRRTWRSIASSPGNHGSRSGGIVLM